MGYTVNLVLLFFFYSCLGWCMEVTLKYIQYHHFINRGFLVGPVCPIYGFGAALITVSVGVIAPVDAGYGTTFALSFLLCGAVEYLTSYYMEKRFHARWWDYSQKPMNLNGRVWIGNLLLFGLGGVAIIHIVNPQLYRLFGSLSLDARQIAAVILLALIAADYTISHFVLKLVKAGVEHSEADNTEEINREVRLLLSDRNIFYRRFADAYPEVVYRTERINARIEAVRTETERIRQEVEHRREQLSSALEPAALIKNTLIDNQAELIDMLYDEGTASDAAKDLKARIDSDRQRLSDRPLSRVKAHSPIPRPESRRVDRQKRDAEVSKPSRRK